MSNNQRDTQFACFARLLSNELTAIAQRGYSVEEYANAEDLCIAQRVYDLVCHVVSHLDNDVMWLIGKGYTASQIIEDISDMTEWPHD